MSEYGLPDEAKTQPTIVLPWKSQTISKLAEALSKAQGEMTGAKKDSENPFFKSRYADLASVWDACRAALANNGLSVVQIADSEGGQITVQTTLLHASGEWISGNLSMTPTKADPQGFGSAISYARRYALAAMVGVYQEDDDANKASVAEGSGLKAPQKKADPSTKTARPSPMEPSVVIASVTSKPGVNPETKAAYVKTTVTDANGQTYTTFDEAIAKMASECRDEKTPVIIVAEDKGKYGLKILEMARANPDLAKGTA